MNAQWVLKRSGNPGPILEANTKNHWDRQCNDAQPRYKELTFPNGLAVSFPKFRDAWENPLRPSVAPWQSSWFSRWMSRVRRSRGIVTRRTSVKTIPVKGQAGDVWGIPSDLFPSIWPTAVLPQDIPCYLLLWNIVGILCCIHIHVLPRYTLICWMIMSVYTTGFYWRSYSSMPLFI